LSRKIPSSGWCRGPGNLSQNGLKPTPLTTSLTKDLKSKMFDFLLQATRLAISFELLNSSLAQLAGKL